MRSHHYHHFTAFRRDDLKVGVLCQLKVNENNEEEEMIMMRIDICFDYYTL